MPANTTRRSGQKIEVLGEIQLGAALDLERDLRRAQAEVGYVVRPTDPDWMTRRTGTPPTDNSRIGISEAQIDYALKPKLADGDKNIAITDDGLKQSYGIFGVPGCGKTVLLMHLLGQLVAHNARDEERKLGGLILDTKATLIDDVKALMKQAGREDDLVVINEAFMQKENHQINVIDCFLRPDDLGRALVLAPEGGWLYCQGSILAQSSGEYFVCGYGTVVLVTPTKRCTHPQTRGGISCSVKAKVNQILNWRSPEWPKRSKKVRLIQRWRKTIRSSEIHCRTFWETRIKAYFNRSLTRVTVLSDRSRYAIYSPSIPSGGSFYDAIIEEGKIVLVSVSRESLRISRILCTLIKTIFQQTVLTREQRYISKELKNISRPLLFLVDEYSDVATEVAGEPMGDSTFFSLMRQAACMGVVATQSIHMLKNSGLGDAWEGILSNMSAKVFMRLGDPETAEYASKLASDSEFRFQTFNRSYAKDGSSETVNLELRDRKNLPPKVLVQTLKIGQAACNWLAGWW